MGFAVFAAPSVGQQASAPAADKPAMAASMPMDCARMKTAGTGSAMMAECVPGKAASAPAGKTKNKRHDHGATKNN